MSTHINKQPVVSIVIINKNEVGVEDTLLGISKQVKAPRFEVVIVDASLGKLDYIYIKFSNTKVIPFISKSKKPVTIPEQRNVGIKATKSPIVVFIDAGCVPKSNWLLEITKPILEKKERIVAGVTFSTGKKTFHDIGIEANSSRRYIDEAPTINLAIERAVFNEVGFFNENLLYGSDMDLTWRIRSAGIKIYSAKKASITHDWGSLRQELKRGYRYGQAKANLYHIHKYMQRKFIRREMTLVVYSLYIVFFPLTILLPWYPLLIIIPALKNLKGGYYQLPIINLVTSWGFLSQITRMAFR